MAQINKTRTKPGTQNPLFQEIFTFDLLQADLVDAILTIDVWNKDSISQDDFLGETVLELYKEEVNGGVASWHNLRPHVSIYETTLSDRYDAVVLTCTLRLNIAKYKINRSCCGKQLHTMDNQYYNFINSLAVFAIVKSVALYNIIIFFFIWWAVYGIHLSSVVNLIDPITLQDNSLEFYCK